MPRIRSIHPGLFTDEAYMEMSPYAMAAWPGLWCQCDDQGVFEWKPIVLKARLLPGTSLDFAGLLDEWTRLGVVRFFDVVGKRYGVVKNFRKFQRPRKPVTTHPVPPETFWPFIGLSGSDVQLPLIDELEQGSSSDEHHIKPILTPEKCALEPQRKEGDRSLDDDDDACARPVAIKQQADVYARTLTDEIMCIAGIDLKFVPPGWCGAPYRVEAWLREGWPYDLILVGVRKTMARKRDGPPDSVKYFEKAIATEIAMQSAPLPTVSVIPAQEIVHVERATINPIAAAEARMLGRIDERIRELETSATCNGAGGTDAKIIS